MFGFFGNKNKGGDGQDGLHCANVPPPESSNSPPKEPELMWQEDIAPPKVEKKHRRVELTVYYEKYTLSWSCDLAEDRTPGSYFLPFVKWFHSREGSHAYRMDHVDGASCFLREGLYRYEIRARDETELEKFKRLGKKG